MSRARARARLANGCGVSIGSEVKIRRDHKLIVIYSRLNIVVWVARKISTKEHTNNKKKTLAPAPAMFKQ